MQGFPWLLVRLVHVLTGVIWAGAAVLIAGYLMPAVRAAGPGGAAVMKQLTVVQRLPAKLVFLGITAIASGGYILWIESAGLSSNWISTGPRAEGATSDENQTLGRLAARIARGTRVVALLLVLATASMAVARATFRRWRD